MESRFDLCSAWAVILLSAMIYIPEFPRFLVEMGKIEKGKKYQYLDQIKFQLKILFRWQS